MSIQAGSYMCFSGIDEIMEAFTDIEKTTYSKPIFIEALAAWIHPDRFQGVSALKTLQEVNERFLTVPMEGTYMIDLKPTP